MIPCTGPISLDVIRMALDSTPPGAADSSLRKLSDQVGFTSPDAISEFRCWEGSIYVGNASGAYRHYVLSISKDAGDTWITQPSPDVLSQATAMFCSKDFGTLIMPSNARTTPISIVYSIDHGVTWKIAPTKVVAGCASVSQDGKFLAYLGEHDRSMHYSADKGVTWQTKPVANIGSTNMDINEDGSIIYILGPNNIYKSINGADWVNIRPPASRYFTMAISADGSRIFIGEKFGHGKVFYSHNAGVTWQNISASMGDISVSCDGAGEVVLIMTARKIFLSLDGCASITDITNRFSGGTMSHQGSLGGRKVSYDGTCLVVGGSGGHVFVSTDQGATWTYKVITGAATNVNTPFCCIAGTGTLATSPAPIANFVADNVTPYINKDIVTFTDHSLNAPTSWLWTFSPGTVTYQHGTNATSQNPQVKFTAAGIYTVTLKATNAIGSDTHAKRAYIIASVYTTLPKPIASFSADNRIPYVSLTTVRMIETSLNSPTSWRWTFTPHTVKYVNGTSAASRNPAVQFTRIGKYTVALRATNTSGSDTMTRTNYIVASTYVLPSDPPVAFFDVSNRTPTKTEVVQFYDRSTNEPNRWLWEFTPNTVRYHGGTSHTSRNPSVSFPQGGSYMVKLTVWNASGSDSILKDQYIVVESIGEGLISYYSMDNTVRDIHNGNQPTLQYHLAAGSGLIGGAIKWNGSNSKAEIGAGSFQVQTISISVWVKLPATPAAGAIESFVTKWDDRITGSKYFWLGAIVGRRLYRTEFRIFGSDSRLYVVRGREMSFSGWTHIVAIKDSSKLTMYVNGTRHDSQSAYINFFPAPRLKTFFGATEHMTVPSNPTLNGWMDELGIWGRTLTQDDVTKLYNRGRGLSYPF